MANDRRRTQTPYPLARVNRTVATVLASARREPGLSQDALARVLGWNRMRIVKIEQGERRTPVSEFTAIARALALDPPQLLSRVLRG